MADGVQNKRRHFRYHSRILGYVFTADLESTESRCCLINFSMGGIALETNLNIVQDTEIRLQINLVPEKINVFGRIVHKQKVMENLYRYGIKYTKMGFFERYRLKKKIINWLKLQKDV